MPVFPVNEKLLKILEELFDGRNVLFRTRSCRARN
jgi:hypothetical protein